MEETYWNKFMASGKVDDYLEYKGIQICHSVMEHYGRSSDAGTEVRRSESDNGYGVYMCGFKEYDGEDDDWTCKPEYEPREKYLMLAGRGFESMVWETLLHQMILALKEIIECGCESVRHFFDGRIVTAGFDEDKLFRVK